jgi:hypothetical protein
MSKVKAGNFTALLYSTLLNIGKSVLKMVKTLWKYSLIVAKGVLLMHGNCIVIAITFSDKKSEEAVKVYCAVQKCIIMFMSYRNFCCFLFFVW